MTDFLDNIVSAWNDEEGEKESELYPDETNSPNINILIRAGRKFLDGKLTQDEFIAEVDATADRLEKALGELQAYAENLSDDDPAKELAEQSEFAYEEFGQGLEEMEKCDPEAVQHGIDLCIEAAYRLEYLNQHYLELEQKSQMVECLRCSHPNPPQRDTCESCSATLPNAMRQASAESSGYSNELVMVPKEYLELYDACDRVASGDMPLEEWQQLIVVFNDRFNAASQQVHDMSSLNQETLKNHPNLLAAAEGVVDALDESIEALHRMHQFADDGDVEHLNQGWMDLLMGTQKLQQRGLNFYQMIEAAQEG